MGKSLGNVLDPVALVDAYGADAVRFFFLKEVDFGQVGQPWPQLCQHILSVSLRVSFLPGFPTMTLAGSVRMHQCHGRVRSQR